MSLGECGGRSEQQPKAEHEDDHWVHNLEHGGIVYLYDCPGGCEAEETQLREMFDSRPAGTVIVTPYAGQVTPSEITAVDRGWSATASTAPRSTLSTTPTWTKPPSR